MINYFGREGKPAILISRLLLRMYFMKRASPEPPFLYRETEKKTVSLINKLQPLTYQSPSNLNLRLLLHTSQPTSKICTALHHSQKTSHRPSISTSKYTLHSVLFKKSESIAWGSTHMWPAFAFSFVYGIPNLAQKNRLYVGWKE